MSHINNPISYYQEMGFLNMDSFVYTCALASMAGGGIGTYTTAKSGQWMGTLPYIAMIVVGGFVAKQGLVIANEVTHSDR